MDWNEVLTNILVALITAFVPVIGTLVVTYVRKQIAKLDKLAAAEIGEQQWYLIKTLVNQFVDAAEQLGVWNDLLKEGKAKKKWVMEQMDKALQHYGIDLDEELISAAIESSVHHIKTNESSTFQREINAMKNAY